MREDFKERVLQRAKERAQNLGYNLTNVAQTDLREFINQGIDRMSADEYDSATRRLIALENIEKLIDNMSRNAKFRSLNESLDYKSFSSARSSICPLWPFC
ncbi:hypothetical protein [Gillisia sp. JM1]|uniref:hypothetical protein n=1 Tax=Gillisia sp. JM1 TaxID=1283286 RepID=UPI00041D51F3|nr:hypothetical protein [Gillisia sp. JM1]